MLELQNNIIPLIWVLFAAGIFAVFGGYVLFHIEDKLLFDLAQKFSQLCVTVIIGFAALVFAIAAVEFNDQAKSFKKSLYLLIECVIYFSIDNLVLFLASYLPEELSKSWIRGSYILSIFLFVIILWKLFSLMKFLLKID